MQQKNHVLHCCFQTSMTGQLKLTLPTSWKHPFSAQQRHKQLRSLPSVNFWKNETHHGDQQQLSKWKSGLKLRSSVQVVAMQSLLCSCFTLATFLLVLNFFCFGLQCCVTDTVNFSDSAAPVWQCRCQCTHCFCLSTSPGFQELKPQVGWLDDFQFL